jgi:hypothetical protein
MLGKEYLTQMRMSLIPDFAMSARRSRYAAKLVNYRTSVRTVTSRGYTPLSVYTTPDCYGDSWAIGQHNPIKVLGRVVIKSKSV